MCRVNRAWIVCRDRQHAEVIGQGRAWHVACAQRAQEGAMRDPVCGKEIERMTAAAETQFEGETYLFCSEDCYQEFMQDPREYTEARVEP